MASAEHEIRIDVPADTVFDFLLDGSNNPSWQPTVIDAKPTSEPLGLGTTFHETIRHPLGFKVSADYEVTLAERPSALTLSSSGGGPIHPTQRYRLTDHGDGSSTVTSTVEYQPKRIPRAAGPALALLHPLFAWEARWIERLPGAIAKSDTAEV
jgi:hypothetical protein